MINYKRLIFIVLTLFLIPSIVLASEWNYTSTNYDISEESAGSAIHWDYTNWWLTGTNTDKVYQYNSTWSYTGINYSLSGQDNTPVGIYKYNNEWYMLGAQSGNVYKYHSNWTYTGTSYNIAELSFFGGGRGMCKDNTNWYIVDTTTDRVFKYNLSFSYTSNVSVSSQDSEPTNCIYDGDSFWLLGRTNDRAYQYNSTWNYTGINYSLSGQDNNPRGIGISTNFWMLGDTNNKVYEYEDNNTAPTITNNVPTEINNYEFDGSWFNCSDIDNNLVSCDISINSNTYSNGTNFNFTSNGYYNYNISAKDWGIETVSNGTLLVNPYQYIYFQLENGTALTNFTLGGSNYNNYANISTYNDLISLGSNTLLFEKFGYQSTNITFTVNTTSNLNLTYNISGSKVAIYIYDRDTGNLITDNVSVVLVGTTGFNSTTSTGNLNISGLQYLDENYQVIANSDAYQSESVYFNFDNRDILEVEVYMIKSNLSNLGTHTIRAVTDVGQLVNGAVCSALEWKPALSAFVSVAQGQTDSNGETVVNVELGTKLYKFYCYKGSASAYSASNKIISSTGLTTTITLESTITTPANTYGDLTYSLTNETINTTHQRITYVFADGNGLVDTGCLKIYKVIGTKFTLLQSSCVTSSSSSIQLIQDVNQTYLVRAIASIEIDGATTNLGFIDFATEYNLKNVIDEYDLDLILPILIVFLAIGMGFLLSPKNIYISMVSIILGIWLCNSITPNTITTNISIYVTIVSLLMMWGAYKFK